MVHPKHGDWSCACKQDWLLLILFPGPKPGEAEHQQSAVWKRKGVEAEPPLGRKLPLSPSRAANGREETSVKPGQNARLRRVEHRHCGSETSAGVQVAFKKCMRAIFCFQLAGAPRFSENTSGTVPGELWPLQLQSGACLVLNGTTSLCF